MNLDECQREMRSIIRELQEIEQGVRKGFSNIGQDLCANCINKVIGRYQHVSRELDKVDRSMLRKTIDIFE